LRQLAHPARRTRSSEAFAADLVEEAADTVEDAAEDLGEAARSRAGGDDSGSST
jgi:hypothetical protein